MIVLFFTQRVGTEKIAFLFSPIIILWLLANLCIAIYNLSVQGGYIFNVSLHLEGFVVGSLWELRLQY